jgi:hypothetical protein
VNYNPNSYLQFDLRGEGNTGTISVDVLRNSESIYTDSVPTPDSNTWLSPLFGPVGDEPWEINLVWNP